MTDDELKKIADAVSEAATRVAADTRRHFDGSTEAIRDDLRLLAEGISGLDKRLVRDLSAAASRRLYEITSDVSAPS
jgi:hypothetical protein